MHFISFSRCTGFFFTKFSSFSAEHSYPPTEEQLLPPDLLRLRRRPTLWQIANLHFSYVESRLDALALCRKAEDSAKRQLASLNGSGVEDADLIALSEALQADSKQ